MEEWDDKAKNTVEYAIVIVIIGSVPVPLTEHSKQVCTGYTNAFMHLSTETEKKNVRLTQTS